MEQITKNEISIEAINLEIRQFQKKSEVIDFLKGLSNLDCEEFQEGRLFTFKESKVCIIIHLENTFISIRDKNIECFTIIYQDFRSGYINFQLGVKNKFVDYISDISCKLKKPVDSITVEYLKKFSNPFIQDSELLKKYNLDSTVLLSYIIRNEHTLKDIILEIKNNISQRL